MSYKSIRAFEAHQREHKRQARTEPPPAGNVDEMLAQAEAFEEIARAARRSARELRVAAGRIQELRRSA